MTNAKIRTGGRRTRVASDKRGIRYTVTTALMADTGAAVPKKVIDLNLRAPAIAATALADKPGKIKPLLQSYGEAFARSREAGRPVSFRVDVDPSGGATVTPVGEPGPEARSYPVEEAGESDPGLQRALEAARERGRLRAAEVLSGEDMVSADEFAKVLGMSRMTVNTKRQSGQVLGLDGAKRGFRFPLWQLDTDGQPYPELPQLHERLGGPWALYRFLVQPHGELDGLTGRQALERGRGPVALAVAEGISRGDFQ